MDFLKTAKPCEAILVGVLVAFSLCDDLGANELNVLGNLLSSIGSMISTWAAQQQLLESTCRAGVTPDARNRAQEMPDALESPPGAQPEAASCRRYG